MKTSSESADYYDSNLKQTAGPFVSAEQTVAAGVIWIGQVEATAAVTALCKPFTEDSDMSSDWVGEWIGETAMSGLDHGTSVYCPYTNSSECALAKKGGKPKELCYDIECEQMKYLPRKHHRRARLQ